MPFRWPTCIGWYVHDDGASILVFQMQLFGQMLNPRKPRCTMIYGSVATKVQAWMRKFPQGQLQFLNLQSWSKDKCTWNIQQWSKITSEHGAPDIIFLWCVCVLSHQFLMWDKFSSGDEEPRLLNPFGTLAFPSDSRIDKAEAFTNAAACVSETNSKHFVSFRCTENPFEKRIPSFFLAIKNHVSSFAPVKAALISISLVCTEGTSSRYTALSCSSECAVTAENAASGFRIQKETWGGIASLFRWRNAFNEQLNWPHFKQSKETTAGFDLDLSTILTGMFSNQIFSKMFLLQIA